MEREVPTFCTLKWPPARLISYFVEALGSFLRSATRAQAARPALMSLILTARLVSGADT
jgi:hypothetical protein